MGYEDVKFEVRAVLSRHNTEQAERDNLSWESLCAQVEALISAPQFREIRPHTG